MTTFEAMTTGNIRHILAVMYILLVLGYIYVLIFKPVPDVNKDLINVLGGTLIGGSGQILSYFFGASKKDEA
jgi:hypothetical protein